MPTTILRNLFVLLLVLFAFLAQAQQLGEESLQGNEQQIAQKMVQLIQDLSVQRDPTGLVKRLNQIKSQGCLNGTFTVRQSIPERFKQGLFAQPAQYPIYARFANASTLDDTEKDLRGFAFRVFDVKGDVIWGEQGKQDFLMNSYPILFAESPEVFYDFVKAQYDDTILSFFLNPFDSHLNALFILLQARDRPASLFDIRYWSTTAFRLGADNIAIKYGVKPCSRFVSQEPADHTANYLREAMQTHLATAPVCFEFMLQQQVDAVDMPIEDPTVEWDEQDAPFITVAQINFNQQDFTNDEAMQVCERASFNPWQGLVEHRPLGRVNLVRRLVYEQMALFRRNRER